jgi:hypothetical protein
MNLTKNVALAIVLCGSAPLFADFVACRRQALQTAGSVDSKQQRQNVQSCLAQYPQAAAFADCKRQVLQKFGKDPALARTKLKDCHKLREALTYRPSEWLPYQHFAGRHLFAGADLSFEVSETSLPKITNFNCERLSNAMSGFDDPQYLLFGNEPAVFPALTGLNPTKILARASRKTSKPYVDLGKLGRYHWKDSPAGLLYFPTAACVFRGDLGDHFEDLQIYYLIDNKRAQLAPYFGVAFYKPGRPLSQVVDRLRARLEQPAASLPNGSQYIGPQPTIGLDHEGLPKNLCAQPRSDRVVGLVRSRKEKPAEASAAFVINLRSLCTFGDRMTEAIIKNPTLKKKKN